MAYTAAYTSANVSEAIIDLIVAIVAGLVGNGQTIGSAIAITNHRSCNGSYEWNQRRSFPRSSCDALFQAKGFNKIRWLNGKEPIGGRKG